MTSRFQAATSNTLQSTEGLTFPSVYHGIHANYDTTITTTFALHFHAVLL